MNLSKNVKIRVLKEAQTSDDYNSDAIDVANFDGVLFMNVIEAAADINNIKIEQKDDDGAWQELENTTVEADANNQILWVDVYRPLEEIGDNEESELRVAVDMDDSGDNGPIIAALYEGRVKPEDNIVAGTEGLKGEFVISPDKV